MNKGLSEKFQRFDFTISNPPFNTNQLKISHTIKIITPQNNIFNYPMFFGGRTYLYKFFLLQRNYTFLHPLLIYLPTATTSASSHCPWSVLNFQGSLLWACTLFFFSFTWGRTDKWWAGLCHLLASSTSWLEWIRMQWLVLVNSIVFSKKFFFFIISYCIGISKGLIYNGDRKQSRWTLFPPLPSALCINDTI